MMCYLAMASLVSVTSAFCWLSSTWRPTRSTTVSSTGPVLILKCIDVSLWERMQTTKFLDIYLWITNIFSRAQVSQGFVLIRWVLFLTVHAAVQTPPIFIRHIKTKIQIKSFFSFYFDDYSGYRCQSEQLLRGIHVGFFFSQMIVM